MKMNLNALENREFWKNAGVKLPEFSIETMRSNTRENPVWVHFGAGNIFRAFIARLQQQLLNEGKADRGIIAVDTFDYDILDKIYAPYDNLTMLVLMNADGRLDKEIVASISEGLKGDSSDGTDYSRLKEIFRKPSLQMISFTITEKGYALKNLDGAYFPVVAQDIQNGPGQPRHAMSVVAALLYERFKAGALPLAVVSMDNCSHNGEKLQSSVLAVAKEWQKAGLVEAEFVAYLEDETKVAFPWSMIDKITPRPAGQVQAALEESGLTDMAPIVTSRNTYIAPYVNAETPEYLVIEDKFPNGRPALEAAGVYMTDRDTVNNTERMKVTTCLNPLHTALAVYGCLLGYTSIAAEMQDAQLKKLVEKIGYEEGMPVVVNPGIIDPMDFIHEVIDLRLPNPYIPDMPQRIATDTSQKVAIRFGETIKSYMQRPELEPASLTYIPLALAGWCRYLLAVDDQGRAMELSSDPMLEQLTGKLAGVRLGDPASCRGCLKEILSNPAVFGVNLYDAGLGEKVESMFAELAAGPGAVRAALVKYLG